MDTLVGRQVTLAVKHKNDLAARGIAEEASLLIDRGIPSRIAERNKDRETLTTCSEWLTSYDEETIRIIPDEHLDTQLTRFQEIAAASGQTAEADLAVLKGEYDDFLKLRDESVSLGQQLRQIATRILKNSADTDVCPLCHTSFGPGELLSHITEGVDEHLERQGQSLFTRLQEQEKSAQVARTVVVAAEWLNAFSRRAHLSETLSVRLALSRVEEAKQTQQVVQARVQALNDELLRLESEGLSGMEPKEISDRLRQFGYPLEDFSRVALGPLLAAIDQNLAASDQTIGAERKEIGELEKRLQESLHSAGISIDELDTENFKRGLSQLRERQTTTKLLQEKVSSFIKLFPWPSDRPFAELIVEAESARTIAADLQTALGREKQAQAAEEESMKRKKQLEQQRGKLLPRIKRFTVAHDDLETLRRQHSLSTAMKDALTQNKTNIELIFSRIHSPAEFRGLGQKWTSLIRKASGKEAQLSEISTGQRAAFALSIFLAQNAQLNTAPPVILIDDPIAHIDDLNSLSFLDYLREIVLTGKRQIFFATANDKLATLFERKFDFLGPQNFCRFDFPPHPLGLTA